MSEEEQRRTAVHEAGHAAVYEVLAGSSISLASAFRKCDHRGGIASFTIPVGCSRDRWNELRLLGGLGGIAATDLVYGVGDPGATDDLGRVIEMIAHKCDDGFAYAKPHMGLPHYQESDG